MRDARVRAAGRRRAERRAGGADRRSRTGRARRADLAAAARRRCTVELGDLGVPVLDWDGEAELTGGLLHAMRAARPGAGVSDRPLRPTRRDCGRSLSRVAVVVCGRCGRRRRRRCCRTSTARSSCSPVLAVVAASPRPSCRWRLDRDARVLAGDADGAARRRPRHLGVRPVQVVWRRRASLVGTGRRPCRRARTQRPDRAMPWSWPCGPLRRRRSHRPWPSGQVPSSPSRRPRTSYPRCRWSSPAWRPRWPPSWSRRACTAPDGGERKRDRYLRGPPTWPAGMTDSRAEPGTRVTAVRSR